MHGQCLGAINCTQPIGLAYGRIPCRSDAQSSQASGFVA
jgi:hypothetical protein